MPATAQLMKQRDLEREQAIRNARKDILSFTRFTKPDYDVAWHHERLAEKLDKWIRGEIRNLMVFMPPRHGKSELVSRRLPAMLHGWYPDAEIMAVSYLDSLAGDMTIDVQNIIDSKEYKVVFPETKIYPPGTSYTKGTRNSSEHHIIGRRGKYRGQGVGGSFTGKGANFIIVDDPIKGREIADSEAFRERLWNFWTNDLVTRLETNLKTGRRGQVLITQTRWHEDDLSGRLLAQMKKKPDAIQFEVVHFPAIRVDRDNKDDPRQLGEALWPKKYNLDQLNEIKAGTTPRGWTAVYQQDPVPGDGNIFKDRMFEFCDLPGAYDYVFVVGDTAYKEDQENDCECFTAFGVIGEKPYILDVLMDRVPVDEVEAWAEPFIRKFIQYGYRWTLIEPKGHGIYLNKKWADKNLFIPSQEDIDEFFKDRRLDKVARAKNVVPHLANRKIYVNNELANKEELVAQCLGFPKMKHDDFVDTVIDGLKRIYGTYVGILDVL